MIYSRMNEVSRDENKRQAPRLLAVQKPNSLDDSQASKFRSINTFIQNLEQEVVGMRKEMKENYSIDRLKVVLTEIVKDQFSQS